MADAAVHILDVLELADNSAAMDNAACCSLDDHALSAGMSLPVRQQSARWQIRHHDFAVSSS